MKQIVLFYNAMDDGGAFQDEVNLYIQKQKLTVIDIKHSLSVSASGGYGKEGMECIMVIYEK